MKVSKIVVTPEAEKLMAYCARVSSNNQNNPDIAGLLSYCLRNKHFSVFETAFLTVEIETSRTIGRQILRHKSFNFQEFSQRYMAVSAFEPVVARKQAVKNRQSSTDGLSKAVYDWFSYNLTDIQNDALEFYEEALRRGVAKECARFALPCLKAYKLGCT